MKIKMINGKRRDAEIREVNDGYGMRLIEQGRAVIAPEPERKKAARKEAASEKIAGDANGA